jgi:hypothetical protein
VKLDERPFPQRYALTVFGYSPGFVMYGIANVPCWTRSLALMMIVPLVASNLVLRLMIFYFLTQLSRQMPQLRSEEMPDDIGEKNMLQRIHRAIYDMGYSLLALLNPERHSMSRARIIRALTFVASAKGAFVIFLVILVPFLIIALVLILPNPTYTSCNGCALSFKEIVEVIAVGAFFLAFGAFAAFRVRHYPDPWGLRREVTLMTTFAVITLIGFILATYFDPPKENSFDFQLVIAIGFIGFMAVQTVYQVYAAYKSEYAGALARQELQEKRRVKKERKKLHSVADSNATSTNQQTTAPQDRLLLKQVVENPTLVAEFEKFLVSELGVESLLFLRDTSEWKRTYFDIAASARLLRAKKLYKMYINPSGSFPVNVPADVITMIRNTVMHDDIQDCPENVFDAAREEISDLLQIGALQRFQHSPLYLNLVGSISVVPTSAIV